MKIFLRKHHTVGLIPGCYWGFRIVTSRVLTLRYDLPQASSTVAIPKEHHRFVIGKNGEKLQELELKTATKIQIPRPDDPSNQIKISGTKEGLEKAKHEILLISAEQVMPRLHQPPL